MRLKSNKEREQRKKERRKERDKAKEKEEIGAGKEKLRRYRENG